MTRRTPQPARTPQGQRAYREAHPEVREVEKAHGRAEGRAKTRLRAAHWTDYLIHEEQQGTRERAFTRLKWQYPDEYAKAFREEALKEPLLAGRWQQLVTL